MYAFITTMLKDDDNDTTCTYSQRSLLGKKGVRQKIETRMKILALIFFSSLPYTPLRRPPGSKTVSA